MGTLHLVLFSPESLLSGHRWRELLEVEPYKSNIVAFVVDKAHCVKKWWVFSWVLTMCIIYGQLWKGLCYTHIRLILLHIVGVRNSGKSTRRDKKYPLSEDVKVMALTATASRTLREDIMKLLRMTNPVVIAVSPDKANIMYQVVPFVSMNATFGTLADQLAEQQLLIGRAITFC